MPELLLELDRVTAGYARDIDVLREVSLSVHAGHVSGLIGLNGAGKSTIVKTICGLLAPKSGRIEYLGRPIAGIAPHRLIDEGICCIPQESSLFPYLTVEENLLLPLQGRSRKYAASQPALFLLRERQQSKLERDVLIETAQARPQCFSDRAQLRSVAARGGHSARPRSRSCGSPDFAAAGRSRQFDLAQR